MATTNGITPILGTLTFGSEAQVNPDVAGTMLRSFIGAGCTKTLRGGKSCSLIDTAGFYAKDTEDALGGMFDMFPSLQRSLRISSHATPEVKPHLSLSKKSIIEQCDKSLEALGLDCLDVFYLHSPDVHTDIDDTLEGIEQLHKDEKITEFGLCNYPAWAVVDIWHRCKAKGMLVPTVYQGRYNVVTRDLEREIVPVVREFGMRLYVYNSLAGGLLTGKYGSIEELTSSTKGRFSEEFDKSYGGASSAGTITYRNRYAKQAILDGVGVLREACAPPSDGYNDNQPKVVEDTTTMVDGRRVRLVVSETSTPQAKGQDMAEISLRWLIHHSCLCEGDGILLGVSQSAHLVTSLGAFRAGPLEDAFVQACEQAWDVARPACEAYFDGYGAKPGGIEAFLKRKSEQNASEVQEEAENQSKQAKS